MDVLERPPGCWAFIDRDFTELYGDWQQWGGMVAVTGVVPQRNSRPVIMVKTLVDRNGAKEACRAAMLADWWRQTVESRA